MFSRCIRFYAAGAVALTFFAASTRANTVGIKFEGSNNSIVTGIAGVPAVAQANWNNEAGNTGTVATGLLDNTGAATSLGVTWNASAVYSANNENNTDQFAGQDGVLMSGYLDQFAVATPLLTVTGLVPGSTHDVYVYSLASVVGRGGNADVNGGAQQNATAATSSTYIPNTNYLLFPGVTADNAGKINFNVDSSGQGGIFRFAVQGVQVTNTPEPASLGLLSLGGLGLLARRRRTA